jgi:Rha family phage regulatory protein
MENQMVTQDTQINGSRQPVVFVRDGEAFASSRDVAEFFDKEHRNVLQAIDNLIVSEPDLALRNFQQGSYTLPSTGEQQHRCFDMTRDGFTLLAMGFTGTKALKWKLKYIEAFNVMEAEIRARSAPVPVLDVRNPKQLAQVAIQLIEVVREKEEAIAQLEPKADALDRIATADGSLCVTDAAKALQVRPKDLFAYLRAHGWVYRRPGTAHDLGYQSKVQAGLLEHKITTVTQADGTERITEQVRVTPKGLTVLAKVFPSAVSSAA